MQIFSHLIIVCIGSILFVWSNIAFAASATYYADVFEGKNTANGDVFRQDYFSSAFCQAPLGGLVYTYTTYTGVTTRMNDRPNCNRYPDVTDLSRVAFERFAPVSAGRVQDVTTTLLAPATPQGFYKRILSQYEFGYLGVELSSDLANTYFAGETIRIQGRVTRASSHVLFYIESLATGEKKTFLRKLNKNGEFDFFAQFPPTPGVYNFVLASGTSFQTEKPSQIYLFDKSTISYPQLLDSSLKRKPFWNIRTQEGDSFLDFGPAVFGELSLRQDTESFSAFGQAIAFSPLGIAGGQAEYTFTGYDLSTSSSLDRSPTAILTRTGSVLIDRVYDSIGADRVSFQKNPRMISFRFRVPSNEKIRNSYYITYPDGSVQEQSFPTALVGSGGFLKPGAFVRTSFSAHLPGTYKVETVNAEGYAYFNMPVSQGEVWNVIRVEKNLDTTLKKDRDTVEKNIAKAINQLRASNDQSLLALDQTLSDLAQKKAENMAQYDYVGHWTPDGKNILEFAKSLGIPLMSPIAENVAGGNVSDVLLQDGLEQSGSHRLTMLHPQYTRVGIGYVLKANKTYLVQVFSK